MKYFALVVLTLGLALTSCSKKPDNTETKTLTDKSKTTKSQNEIETYYAVLGEYDGRGWNTTHTRVVQVLASSREQALELFHQTYGKDCMDYTVSTTKPKYH